MSNDRVRRSQLWGIGLLLAGFAATCAAHDAMSAVQVLRIGGCGGFVPAAQPLRHNTLLDRIAAQWATGTSLSAAAQRSGFRPELTAGLYVRGTDASLLEELKRANCRTVTSRALREIGAYHSGLDTWLVMTSVYPIAVTASTAAAAPPVSASPNAPAASPSWSPPQAAGSAVSPRPEPARPPPGATASGARTPTLASRALQLVNDVRARGIRCGGREFAPAPPLTFSGMLAGVALGHAADMADQNYFEHEDLAGHSPADRVRAVGYREKLVGENIAYGPATLEEVVQGWLDSPGHCENIMDPRFVEMGIAYASGRASRHGMYWVQVLATPRA
jgi:uncharacterized protein YkwD